VAICKGTRDSLICILWEIIRQQCITFGRKKMQLAAEVFPLLSGYLCGLRAVREQSRIDE
jgi:hypothetical protein